MTDLQATAIATKALYQEALYLDLQDWDAWLEMYDEQVEYWLPSWKSESELVIDVGREISLIYHTKRSELEERVLRIRSRKSVTAMPLPRTAHLVSNILVLQATADKITCMATWTVHENDPRSAKSHSHFGRYEIDLACRGETWKFTRKKIVLLNDLIPTVVDFYNI